MAFDIRRKQWSAELLALAEMTPEQFSTPVEAGTVIGGLLPERAAELGLNPQMKIVAGGHDQSCAALGSGLYDRRGCETSMLCRVDRVAWRNGQRQSVLHQPVERKCRVSGPISQQFPNLPVMALRMLQYAIFIPRPFPFQRGGRRRGVCGEDALERGQVFILHFQHDIRQGSG